MGIQGKCILSNRSDWIETQTVDISIMGLVVKTDRPLPFKNGCELGVLIQRMELPQAKLMWTKKDFNNTTRLGLKFQLPFPGFKHKYLTL
jgi:hypothetical protein